MNTMPLPAPAILDRVRVVLSHPSHPGNIGAAARAMKTMGLSRLILVNPKVFPDAQADAMAAGATDVLVQAEVVSSLAEALSGTRAGDGHDGAAAGAGSACAVGARRRSGTGGAGGRRRRRAGVRQ
jgi:hypothetical protein